MSVEPRHPQFDDIVAIIGEAAALKLCHELGGTRHYLAQPANIGPENKFARAIGLAAARALAQAMGGTHVEPPLGPSASAARQARMIERLIGEGLTNNVIAQRVRCTRRTVQAHRRRLEEGRQVDLFNRGRAA